MYEVMQYYTGLANNFGNGICSFNISIINFNEKFNRITKWMCVVCVCVLFILSELMVKQEAIDVYVKTVFFFCYRYKRWEIERMIFHENSRYETFSVFS